MSVPAGPSQSQHTNPRTEEDLFLSSFPFFGSWLCFWLRGPELTHKRLLKQIIKYPKGVLARGPAKTPMGIPIGLERRDQRRPIEELGTEGKAFPSSTSVLCGAKPPLYPRRHEEGEHGKRGTPWLPDPDTPKKDVRDILTKRQNVSTCPMTQ